MAKKKRWVARIAFEVQFEAASPNQAVKRGEVLVDKLRRATIDDLPVTASSGAMVAEIPAGSAGGTGETDE